MSKAAERSVDRVAEPIDAGTNGKIACLR